MYITPIGAVLIPLSLAIFLFRPDDLAPWAIIVSAFQAASVLNLEGGFPIGVTPYFFVSILIATRFIPAWLSGRCSFVRSDVAISMAQPLLILMVWAVASAFLLPHLFAGIGVNTPRAGMDSPETTPLQWTMSNAAQAAYLVLNTIVVLYQLWQSRIKGYFERLIMALVFSGLIAALIGSYQYVAHYSGLPYPTDFFNSNSGWKQLTTEQLSGVWRLSATCSEPSAAGALFAVWCTLLLFLASDDRGGGGWAWPMFLMGMIMIFLTTSTTGYLIGLLLIALFIWKEVARAFIRGKISVRGLFSLLVIAGSVAAAAIFIPHLNELLTKIVWHKSQSQSSRDRATTIFEALRITTETYGMGVGLGSNRPSGMLFYIASNLGIPGLIAFTALVWTIYRVYAAALRANPRRDRLVVYLGVAGWACAIELIAMASAGGDMSGPLLWNCIGILAAGNRALWLHGADAREPIELRWNCRVRELETIIVLREEYAV